MHVILTANISQMVTDVTYIIIAIKYLGCRLTYLDMTLPHFKAKVKVMHIPSKNISQIVMDMITITIAVKYDVASWIYISIL